MRIATWIVAGVLALAFLFIGGSKVFSPPEVLQAMASGVPVTLLKVAGVAEMIGAVGLVLPAATRVLPILTPIAAVGLVVTMAGAIVTNIIIGAYPLVVQPLILGLLAGFVAWARFGRCAISPRTSGDPAVVA